MQLEAVPHAEIPGEAAEGAAAVNLSIDRVRGRMLRMAAPFLLVVGLLALMGVASVDLLSSMRAFVANESLWSKGQKDAFAALRDYLQTGDPIDFRRYESALAVPLAYRQMRLELEKPDPDFDVARAAFLRGGSHPDDWAGASRLLRLFRHTDLMHEVVALRQQVDDDIVELQALALGLAERDTMHDARRRAALRARIDVLDATISARQQRFSTALGEASREIRQVLIAITVLLAVLLAAMGALFASRARRRLDTSQRSLRDSNARWELAAAAADIGVFDWYVTDEEVLLDARGLALLGIRSPHSRWVTTHRLLEMTHAEDLERVSTAFRDPPVLLDLRFRLLPGDARVRHLELCGRRSRSGTRLVGVLRDVTDEVQAQQLRAEKQAAETASRAKSEFLSRASHELRTPLNAVLGFAQMMSVDPRHPLHEVQQRRLHHVQRGGQYLLKLVNDMLDVSAIEHGALSVTIDDVDLADVLQATIGLLEPMRADRDVRIDCHVPPGLAVVRADRTRLEQVFVNLLSNAIKYNRRGGEVVFDATVEGREVVVTVRDSGIGMTPDQVARLFQPFSRAGAEFSGIEGAGLGLVVSRLLVRRFGGRIDLHSEKDVGTRVQVCLPLCEAESTAEFASA